MDICPEELHNSRQAEVALMGDIKATVSELDRELGGWRLGGDSEWWAELKAKRSQNQGRVPG